MPRINSSAISFVEYSEDRRELYITFTSGKKYTYFSVPLHIYLGLIGANSAGEYFNDNIKDKY